MERITYVLLNSVTENRAGFLSFVNPITFLSGAEALAPHYEFASGVPVAGLPEMGMFAAEKEGRMAFPSSDG
jgi:hypothetical protein